MLIDKLISKKLEEEREKYAAKEQKYLFQINQLQEQIVELKLIIENIKRENEKASSQIKELNIQIAEKDAQINRLSGEFLALKKQNAEYEKAWVDSDTEVSGLKVKVSSYAKEIEQLKKQNADHTLKNKSIERANLKASSQITDLNEQLVEKNKQINRLSGEFSSLTKQNEQLHVSQNELERTIAQLKMQYEKQNDEHKKIAANYATEVSLLNLKILCYEKEIDQLKKQNEQLKIDLEKQRFIEESQDQNGIAGPGENYDFDGDGPDGEKKQIVEKIENSSDNFFITGKAGTGKSYLLTMFRRQTKKNVLYAAPTGVAALNIQGETLHSIFGFDKLKDGANPSLTESKTAMCKNIDCLVIDEISMVRVDVFSQIDKILKKARGSNQPFGGVQIVIIGDVFQLPPVAKNDEKKILEEKYGGVFFFNSPAYQEGNFIAKELKKIYRQRNDFEFIQILNHIRSGEVTDDDIDILNEHVYPNLYERVIQLVPKKDRAEEINNNELSKIRRETFVYHAPLWVEPGEKADENDFTCVSVLTLKVGASVMMISNDTREKRWVNGTLGIVSKLTETQVWVIIDGMEYEVEKQEFAFEKSYAYQGNLCHKKIASMKQFPLILAYAITIHKSQGKTYKKVACDLTKCFEAGQVYVALSRCENLNTLYLTSAITKSVIKINPAIKEFFNNGYQLKESAIPELQQPFKPQQLSKPLQRPEPVKYPSDIIDFLEMRKVEYSDLRHKGGCLWIISGSNILTVINECQVHYDMYFKYAERRKSWWAK